MLLNISLTFMMGYTTLSQILDLSITVMSKRMNDALHDACLIDYNAAKRAYVPRKKGKTVRKLMTILAVKLHIT